MNKIKSLAGALDSFNCQNESTILKIAYEIENIDGFNIYHDVGSSLTLDKIFQLEKGCFGAYFANQYGFNANLNNFIESVESNELDEDLEGINFQNLNNELEKDNDIEADEDNQGFFHGLSKRITDKAKEVGTAVKENLINPAIESATSSAKQIAMKRILERPLLKVVKSYEAKLLIRHFAEEINDDESYLDGLAIFGNENIYLIMGIISGKTNAEIYDLCSSKQSGISSIMLEKAIELCSDLGVKKIEMHTRESSSYSLMSKLKNILSNEEGSDDQLEKLHRVMNRVSDRHNAKYMQNIDLSQSIRNIIEKIESINFGFVTQYNTKLKNSSKNIHSEIINENPEEHYGPENYYETIIILK